MITFVLAGAALDIAYLRDYWLEAILIAVVRLAGQFLSVILLSRKSIGLSIGLQPMSSIALVLLVNTQMLYSGMDAKLFGMLMATILLMQVFGPLATQTAIKGFGEATRNPFCQGRCTGRKPWRHIVSRRPLRRGLSARIYHPQHGATGLQSKSLQYRKQSVAHLVMSREVMVFMIPSVSGDGIVHRSSSAFLTPLALKENPMYWVCSGIPNFIRPVVPTC